MRSVSDEIAYSVIVAIGFHTAWVFLASAIGHPIDGTATIALLLGNFGKDSGLLPAVIAAVTEHKAAIAVYFLSVYAGAAGLGLGMHALVRSTHLDLRHRSLRFENPWYYLLHGEANLFGRRPKPDELPSGVYVSAIVDVGKDSYVYWGIVEDFSFDGAGNLDRVLLTFAHRRPLQSDRQVDDDATDETDSSVFDDSRFYEIRGDFLSIRYADMKNINVDYFWVTEDT